MDKDNISSRNQDDILETYIPNILGYIDKLKFLIDDLENVNIDKYGELIYDISKNLQIIDNVEDENSAYFHTFVCFT